MAKLIFKGSIRVVVFGFPVEEVQGYVPEATQIMEEVGQTLRFEGTAEESEDENDFWLRVDGRTSLPIPKENTSCIIDVETGEVLWVNDGTTHPPSY